MDTTHSNTDRMKGRGGVGGDVVGEREGKGTHVKTAGEKRGDSKGEQETIFVHLGFAVAPLACPLLGEGLREGRQADRQADRHTH